MSKTAVAIRHLAFEDLGSFESPLKEAGYTIRYHDVGIDSFSGVSPLEADLLIVLGGPIGAYEEQKYPFLLDELAILSERLIAQRPTIGICLGAQLVARALGANVYPAKEKEIGFAPITLTEAGLSSCVSVFSRSPVLHWHGDTFDLPAGAELLASTTVCENQAFSVGKNVIAFQFHPEAGGGGFERWLIGHTAELAAAGVDIMSLRQDSERLEDELQAKAGECLKQWLNQLPQK